MSSEASIRRLIKYKGPCCMSCHDEEEEGFSDMHEVELSKGRIVYLCCNIKNAFDVYVKDNYGK